MDPVEEGKVDVDDERRDVKRKRSDSEDRSMNVANTHASAIDENQLSKDVKEDSFHDNGTETPSTESPESPSSPSPMDTSVVLHTRPPDSSPSKEEKSNSSPPQARRFRCVLPAKPAHHIDSKDVHEAKNSKSRKVRKRWRTADMAEDYISMVERVMYPSLVFGPFGHDPKTGRHPIERPSALGYFTHPLRRPSVIEKWSPFEVAKFEGAMAIHGKVFHKVQRAVETKTTKEVVEFYYIWKKTSHYDLWKTSYVPEFTFVKDGEVSEEDTPIAETASTDTGSSNEGDRKRRRGGGKGRR